MPYQGLPGWRAGERRGRGIWREEGTVSAPQFSCHQHVCRCTMLTALWLLRAPAGSWSRSRSRNLWKRRYHHRMREIPTRSQSQIRWRLDLSAHRQTNCRLRGVCSDDRVVYSGVDRRMHNWVRSDIHVCCALSQRRPQLPRLAILLVARLQHRIQHHRRLFCHRLERPQHAQEVAPLTHRGLRHSGIER